LSEALVAPTLRQKNPDARKAAAVKASLEGEITPSVPASILRRHQGVSVYLDRDSAGQLGTATRGPVRERDDQ
jgi:glucosamine-6-phosphate deaminase